MAQFTFPSVLPNSATMRLVSNTKTFTSPLNGAVQTVSRGGTRHVLSMSFQNLLDDDQRAIVGFLSKLNGQTNRANIIDPTYYGAGGGIGYSIVVDGSGQTGTILSCRQSSGSDSEIDFLLRGDKISFFNGSYYELKTVTESCDLSAGSIDIPIMPEIHKSPSNSASIALTNPLGTFLMASPDFTVSYSAGPDGKRFADVSVTFVEEIA